MVSNIIYRGLRIAIGMTALALILLAGDASAASEYLQDGDTVLLDHFNSANSAEYVNGTLNYVNSLPGLNTSADFKQGNWIRYAFPGWYIWSSNYDPSGKEGTVEMWVNPRKYNIGLFWFQWNNVNSPPSAGYTLSLGLRSDGKLSSGGWTAISGTPTTPYPVGKTTIPLNEWTHVAVTWGPSGTKLYVNGIIDAEIPDNLYPALNNQNYVYVNNWGGSDLGYIDELRISKVARTEFSTILQNTTQPTVLPTTVPPTTVPPTAVLTTTVPPTITTPPPTCEEPMGKFETALRNFRAAEDSLEVAQERYISEKEAIPRDENRQAKKEKLWMKFREVVKEFLDRRIDLLIADIELLKCDAKFTGISEILPFDASTTLDKHRMELENIRIKLQQATEKQELFKIDRDLRDIKEKFELEKRYSKGMQINNRMDIFFTRTDDASVRMNELIKKLNENSKDTSKLTGMLSDFNNLMNQAKENHKKNLDIFRSHSGFDSAGMVTDIRNAQDFIRQIKEEQKDTERLRYAIGELKEFFGEAKMLIQQDSKAPVTGGVKT